MSNIEWTDEVWNPLVGCRRVSAGCEHCYAERMASRLALMPHTAERYAGTVKGTGSNARWTGRVNLVPEVLTKPLGWKKPRTVFVNSMSDLFHEGVPFEYIAAVFGVMAATLRHRYIVLTKRDPRPFFRWLQARGSCPWTECHLEALLRDNEDETIHRRSEGAPGRPWPLPNVILGVSVEDQAAADERIPWLLDTPAACRAVSYEPALGPVDLTPLDGRFLSPTWKVDWVIVGGESGPGARPFDVQWARDVILECREARVPVFVKQIGAKPVVTLTDRLPGCLDDADMLDAIRDKKGGDMTEWPVDIRVREMPEWRR